MPRALMSVFTACAALAFAPGAAGADGLPVPVDGAEGASVTQPDGGGPRYTTVSNGQTTTLLQIDQDGGEILGSLTVDGHFTIPLVATDGTASGISGDGSRLVLIKPRSGLQFPREESSFVVVNIREDGRMRAQPPFALRGDFSFDALSPDGLSLFLIEYTTRDYNDYVVREYDFAEGGLVSEPVLVPDEEPGEMRGLPQTRVTSADGRWEYTLYDGAGKEPFIHGLDTVESTSVCIDLPQLDTGRDIFSAGLTLPPGGDTLSVTGKGGELVATVDTETFEVSDPPAPASSAPAEPGDDGGISGVAVGAIAAGIVLVAGTAIGLRRRRRDTVLPADPFGPEPPETHAESQSDPDRERVSN